ncbi:hypothetical protein KKD62_01575 [Patescibacteria group bacterium]|nr:hypothetical protein [Patescibacteria group bacterium]MBU1931412.1 hypothetical protein [Patescibacteria group bacterium]
MLERNVLKEGIFWQGSFAQAMRQEEVFPKASEKVLDLVEGLLVSCARFWWPVYKDGSIAIIRGSVVKNLIRPSEVGPKLPAMFQAFYDGLDPDSLVQNPIWQEALEEGIKGQDLDVRFLFQPGRNFNNMARVFIDRLGLPDIEGKKAVWELENITIKLQENTIPVKGGKERHNWKVEFWERDQGEEKLTFWLDIGEQAFWDYDNDARLGYAATYHDLMMILGLTLNTNNSLLLQIDQLTADVFNTKDRPMSSLTSVGILSCLRVLVGHYLWGVHVDDYFWQLAGRFLTEFSLGREAEHLKYLLLLHFLDPDKFDDPDNYVPIN